jgi:hypothetical protein
MHVVTICAPVDADLLRLRSEFLSMPALCLTVPQTARLLAVRQARAGALLDGLVAEGFLIHTGNGQYRRVPRPAGFIPPAP